MSVHYTICVIPNKLCCTYSPALLLFKTTYLISINI